MNASPTLRKILLISAAAALVCNSSTGWSQDFVTLQDGSRRQGEVVGIDAQKNIRIQTQAASGVVTTTVPLANVQSVSMNPPTDLLAAEEAWQKGDAASAAAKLDKLVNSFLGLPAPWVQRATLLLIDTLLDIGKTDEAEAILVRFQQAYPDSADSTALIRAKIVIARNNFAGARPLLVPIIEEAKQTNIADTTQSIKFGQAFFLMGQIREHEGDLPGALEDYLRSSVIFFADSATAAKAQARAEFLMNEKNVIVP